MEDEDGLRMHMLKQLCLCTGVWVCGGKGDIVWRLKVDSGKNATAFSLVIYSIHGNNLHTEGKSQPVTNRERFVLL